MKRAFTLIELMVVISMIAILMASMGVSVAKARTRAKISQATQEAKEMTNAILAFEQYAQDHSLDNYLCEGWTACTEGNMGMILGREKGENGNNVPVLFNAKIKGGKLLDPWGRPYEYMIRKSTGWEGMTVGDFKTAPVLPNFFRLSDAERQ